MLTASQLHDRGLGAANSGRFGAARRLLNTAAARDPDTELRDRIDLSLAYVTAEQGDLETGLALCTRVLTRTASPQVAALAHSQLGLLHMRAGQSTEALRHLNAAMRSGRLDDLGTARAMINRGVVQLQRGHARSAAGDLDRAAVSFEALNEPIQAAQARHNSGYALLPTGDLVGALHRMEAARSVLAPLSPAFRAVCDQDRAEVLLAAGLISEARVALAGVVEAYGAQRLRRNQAEAEALLARLLLVEHPDRARLTARRAARRLRALGLTVWADRAELIELEASVTLGREPALVVRRAEALATRLQEAKLPRERATALLQAVRAEVARGRPVAAAERLKQIRIDPEAPVGIRVMEREVRAQVAAARGHRGRAWQQVRAGLTELHLWQSSFGSLDLQSSLIGHGRRLALTGIRLALASGDPAEVFEWSERARALSSRVLPLPTPDPHRADQASADDLRELRRLRNELAAGRGSRHDAARERALRDRVRHTGWAGAGSGSVLEPVSLGTLRTMLGQETTFLAHQVVGGQLHLLEVAPDRVRVMPMGSFAPITDTLAGLGADLATVAGRLPVRLSSSVRAGLGARLARLGEQLLGGVEVGTGRVVLTPTVLLSAVPWGMLPSLRGQAITIPRSATRWVHALGVPHPGGAPDAPRVGLVAGPGVERAMDEVTVSARHWPGARILTGSEATAERVSDLARGVDLLHVSAHGRHVADNPLFSGVELMDGTWFGYDVGRLDSTPAAVLLSACELGMSTARAVEETLGMTTVWLHAGARCVIASPAPVNDDLACEVLQRVHSRLASGSDPATALAQGSAEVGGAPFQCYGTGW